MIQPYKGYKLDKCPKIICESNSKMWFYSYLGYKIESKKLTNMINKHSHRHQYDGYQRNRGGEVVKGKRIQIHGDCR